MLSRSASQGEVTSKLAPRASSRDELRVSPSSTDRFGVLLVVLALVLGAATLLVFFSPTIPFALLSPEADTVVNAAATVAAGCVAAFAWIRYRDSHRNDALLQSAAFLTLFVYGLTRTTMQIAGDSVYSGFSIATPGQAPVYSWTFARMIAGILLLAGAISTLNRWSPPGWRAGLMLWIGPLVTLGYAGLTILLDPSLPTILPVETLQRLLDRGSVLESSLLSLPLVVVELLIAFVFVVAAIAY